MKRLKITHDLAGLIKYVCRAPWDDAMDMMLSTHIGPACDAAELEPDDLLDLVGDADEALLWGCAVEDLMAQVQEPDGLNLVDDYLKRRGWKETAPNKAYMRALRDAVMSLYQVGNVIPGRSMILRDLLRDTSPVTVYERSATQSLVDGDTIGARVVEVSGRYGISGALLRFTADGAALVSQAIDRVSTQPISEAGFDVTDREALLRAFAPMFTNIWVMDRLGQLPDDDLDWVEGDELADDLADLDLDLEPLETDGLFHQVLTRRFAAVLDEPLPALGNKSPRALARTPAGRVKVANWLKFVETQVPTIDGSDPVANYDFGWMWDELGLRELRG